MKQTFFPTTLNNLINRLNDISLFAMGFLIPFNSLLMRYMLGIFIVSSLWVYSKRLKDIQAKHYAGFLPLLVFFLLYAISFLYSEAPRESLLDLQKKVSLVLLPLALFISGISREKQYHLFFSYLYGILAVTGACVFYFIYRFFTDSYFHSEVIGYPFDMIYSNFYFLGNVNYYAVYLNIATILILGIMVNARFTMFTKQSKRMMYTGLFISIALVLLLSSRAGVLAILIVLLFSVYYLSQSRYIQIFSLIILFLGVFYISKNHRFRNYIRIFKQMIYSSEYLEEDYLLQQSALRMVFWEGAVRVIQDHTWFGVGNGDVKSSMQDIYREMGVYDKLKTKDNPHNQFLRTFVATGIPGLTALLAFFVYGIVTGIRYRNYLLIALLILFAIHFFFKSMLFRIDGVVCFSFFYGLLWFNCEHHNNQPGNQGSLKPE